MKYCILLAVLAGLAVGQKEYDFETFKSEIDAKCLARLWTNRDGPRNVQPFGNTLASFISMVEKVEGNNTGWTIYDVSKALLKRFAFEGIAFQENPGRLPVQSPEATIRWNIAKELVGDVSSSVSFEENNLSDEEKCSMFFMMGHLVNNTFRDGFDDPDDVNEVPAEKTNGDGIVLRTGVLKTVKQPREQGVISVHGSKNQAIAIAMVLNAILASNNDGEQDAEQVYHIPPTSQPIKIRPLIAITLGEVLTRAARRGKNNEVADRFFGPGGDWNSTLCPTQYNLNKNVLAVTNALLRGAIDGLLIGQALKDGTDYPGTRLSRVLRMYYSRKGLPKQDSKQQGYSYCRREDVMEVMGGLGGNEAVLAYYKLFSYLSDRQFPNDESNNHLSNAITQMNAALSSLHSGTGTEECKISREPSPDQPTCETPSNVFVVLDNSERGTSGFDEQENVVGMLTNRIDFGEGSGSLSVFQSALAGPKRLKEVALNASNPTCATCKTAWLQQGQLTKADGEFQLMEALNDTLREFESKTGLLSGVPSRVVVLFHYDTPKDDKSTLQKAGNMLRDGHRDTRIFAVGSRDGLGPLVNGETNVITGNSDDDAIVKDLSSRICKVPAIFQYNKCYDKKSSSKNEGQNVYTGYVTDNHVQFWAFYPEYFLKSYNIKIKFRAMESGDIYICEQRGVENPGYTSGLLKRERCKKTDAANREQTFSFSNPCETYNVNNCPPINFAIIGEAKDSRIAGCQGDDKKCRRLDQIKFQMSHEGISCNGCEFLKSSPVVLAVIFLLSIINYKV